MDTQRGDGEEAGAKVDEHFIIYSTSCSDDDDDHDEIQLSHRNRIVGSKQAVWFAKESSPPLLLAFSAPCGRVLQDSSLGLSPSSGLKEEEEEEDDDSDHHIEEWMVLGGGEQDGDSSIQLNLSYWNSSSSEDEDLNVKAAGDTWAVSERDKCSAEQSVLRRNFMCDPSLTCHICKRTGHLAKACHIKKCPTCVLCGVHGHIQRVCPTRPCITCGRPSHGIRPCEKPPIWNQHCQRCGMTGHLSDTCPDTWRQFHLTTRFEIPVRRQKARCSKDKKHPAHCYNCSAKGHYGFECKKKRMVSGTFPMLPYVCRYDPLEDIIENHMRMQKRAKELVSGGSLLPFQQLHLAKPTGESGEENQMVHVWSRRNKEARSSTCKRKTWPERRKERHESKRLRREAQARREGRLIVRSQGQSDNDSFTRLALLQGCDLLVQPPKKKRMNDPSGKGTRKSRETERWKKRGGMIRGDVFPNSELGGKKHPVHRVCHRRR